MPETIDPKAQRVLDRYSALVAIRRPWETLWADIAAYVMPRRAPGMQSTVTTPSTTEGAVLFDTTAVRANITLANGQLAWMSPLETAWFSHEPPSSVQDDDARLFLARAAQVNRQRLATSNFYTSIHEFYLDRGAMGTACLYLELTTKRNGRRVLNAQHWPVGTYVIDEDADGEIDTVIREMKLTARQAVQKFGEDNVSPKVKAAAANVKKAGDKFDFLHAIMPREDSERDLKKRDAANMPIATLYVEKDSGHICMEGGHEEMPVFVSRYLEWGTGLGGMYGWSPAFVALPEARQLNFLQMWMDAVAERLADPPWLAPDELEGEIDTNARGVTYFSKDLASMNALPRPLTADIGDVRALLQRVQERQQSIKDAFHVDLFQMFAQLDKAMTAREVAERSQEKLINFSPTFARMTTELFNPLLERLFAIGIREQWYGEVPQSLIVPVSETEGEVAYPEVQYSSRIALALRSLPMLGYLRTLDRLSVVAELNPAVLDNYNFDEAERAAALVDGVPDKFLRTVQERDEIRAERAQAQQVAAQQQQAMLAAEAAAKLGNVPGDSPVGRVIEQQTQAAA